MKKIFFIVIGFLMPMFCLAVETGLETSASGAGLSTDVNLPNMAGTVIGYFLGLIGILFFLLVLYGGFLWMTARGDTDQVKKARDLIINAVLGLVIVFAAYAITYFVVEGIAGATIEGVEAQ